jgi:hypothetical protein
MKPLPEIYEKITVPQRLRAILYSAPLRIYARNCWHGGLYKGERRAPILQTRGTDTFSECLAYGVMNNVIVVADSGVREYDVLYDATAERHAIRLGALFSGLLTQRLLAGINEDREGIGFEGADANIYRTVDSFRAVSQVMYPTFVEVRDAFVETEDSAHTWLRAIDLSLFLNTDRLVRPDDEKIETLARTLDDASESFYTYFLATLFGEMMYERGGNSPVGG